MYYSPQGYWKGSLLQKKLADEPSVSIEVASDWLKKQAIWQIYLPAPKHIPRPFFNVTVPNEVHQADLLFLPHDRPGRGRKLYKYALTVVDVASRYFFPHLAFQYELLLYSGKSGSNRAKWFYLGKSGCIRAK